VALLGCALAACFTGTPAGATVIDYTTTGAFTAGTDATVSGGGSVITITDPSHPTRVVTITYTPNAASVNTPVVADLGTFTVATSITGQRLDIPTSPLTSKFDLTVHQLGPIAGTGTFASKLAGSVSFSSGFVEIQFQNTQFNIGTANYTLVNLTTNFPPFPNNTLLLDIPATGGKTHVKAYITGGAPVPEPSSIALAASGVAGLLGVGCHRRLRTRRTLA
jgi:hypothetical protein